MLSLNPERIGAEAIDLLIDLIEHGAPEEPHRIVPFKIVERGSTQRGEVSPA